MRVEVETAKATKVAMKIQVTQDDIDAAYGFYQNGTDGRHCPIAIAFCRQNDHPIGVVTVGGVSVRGGARIQILKEGISDYTLPEAARVWAQSFDTFAENKGRRPDPIEFDL